MIRTVLATALALALGLLPPMAGAQAMPDMGARARCLAGSGGVAVSAHRGGPSGPENSLSAVRASLAAGVTMVEVDVALSRDGRVMLMHDRTLDRTTEATGPLAVRTAGELRRIRLRDRAGEVTDETVPTLAAVLALARGQAVVSVDFKTPVRSDVPDYAVHFDRLVRAVVREVRRARAQGQVVLSVYSPRDAAAVRARAGWAALSVSAGSTEALAAYRAAGIDPARSLVFTGAIRDPDTLPPLVADPALATIVGTLGAPGRRLDDRFIADGDLSEYLELARRGSDVIATDEALAVQAALAAGPGRAALQAARACLVGQS